MALPGDRQQGKLSRRDWLRLSAAGALGGSVSGWLGNLASAAAADSSRKRSCILLWMNGGPSQMDTFDLKPAHKNGGPFKEIQTTAPSLRISEHLPRIAAFGKRLAVVRSMSTREGEHGRATFLMRTGYQPTGPVHYPTLGSLVAHELGSDEAALPSFVSISPFRFFMPTAFRAGFLGPRYDPLIVGERNPFVNRPNQPPPDPAQILKVENMEPPADVDRAHAEARLEMWQQMESDFVGGHPGLAAQTHQTAYQRAVKLMRTGAGRAFNLEDEKPAVRDRYGRSLFGQGCLLARRLVERGVPFVEVTLAGVSNNIFGWDTHQNNFEAVKQLSAVLDAGWAALMQDLGERGLLDSTLIVWMGEFGRTPFINRGNGRDHYPAAWSTVLAGGGIKGGQALGKTSRDGTTVESRPVSVADFLATVCLALGIDPRKQNTSNVGRPIRIVDKEAKPLREALA